MTSFYSWDTVKEEVFDAEDLEVIATGAQRTEHPIHPVSLSRQEHPSYCGCHDGGL